MSVQPLPVGTLLGEPTDAGPRYQVLDVMGRGGFGITYRCLDRKLGVEVVIKELAVDSLSLREPTRGYVVPTDQTASNAARLERVMRRFATEAQTLARISHQARTPHVVHVFDQWAERGTAYYAMSMVRARGIWPTRTQTAPISAAHWERMASFGRQLLEALEIVHTHGVACHGDLKPANVLIDDNDRVVIIDFGTVRGQEELSTGSRTVMHTPAWSAPELQRRSSLEAAGPWSDLYGWGLLMWGAARRHPLDAWDDDARAEVPTPLEAHDRTAGHDPYGDPRALTELGVPEIWAHAIVRCLAVEPGQRPRSAREVLDFLKRGAVSTAPAFGGARGGHAARSSTVLDAEMPDVQPPQWGATTPTGGRPTVVDLQDDAFPAPRPSRAGVVVIAALFAAAVGVGLAFLLFGADAADTDGAFLEEPEGAETTPADPTPAAPTPASPRPTAPARETTPSEHASQASPRTDTLPTTLAAGISRSPSRWVYRVSRRAVGAARDEAADQEYLVERVVLSRRPRGSGHLVTFEQRGGISQPSERELVFEDTCVASPLDGQRGCIPSSRRPSDTFHVAGTTVPVFTSTLQLERGGDRVPVTLSISPTWGVVEERFRDFTDGREREWTTTLVAASVDGRTLGDPSVPVPFCDWHDSSFRRSGIYENEYRSNENRAWDSVDLPSTAGFGRLNLRQAGSTLRVDFDGFHERSYPNSRFYAAKAWSDGIRTWIMLELDQPGTVEFVVLQVQNRTVREAARYAARLQPRDRYGIFILANRDGCFFEFRRFVGSATHIERRTATPSLQLIGSDRLFP